MKIRIDIASALNGLYDYGCRAVSALDGAGRSAADMEAYAKSNRPWTDRTGNSVFLELGYGGKYALLAPTVHHFAPDALLRFARSLNELK